MNFSNLDYIVFIGYIIGIVSLGLWVSKEKKGHEKDTKDYFLAGKSLPWWAIGASLIASNISAEQIIGMSGSGYVVGLAIASYEWMAALTLIIVAKYFLPIFLEKGIYTMPQFLEIRFDKRVRTSLAVFWLLVYIFVNLTSVLYLGALALKTIMNIDLIYGIIGLALFSSLYTIYGGLKAVAWTDVVQVIVLIAGGLVTSILALNAVSGGSGWLDGLGALITEVPEKFDMILDSSHPSYAELPGISVLIGGMWIANLFYWGCNQYITQRALAAKNLKEAQNGLAFAAYLKILMPLIVVIPGIAAFHLQADIIKPDEAYPWLLSRFVPVGLKGLAFAALIAAIVSSLSSMVNSTATIFSMDIYKQIFDKSASEKKLVRTGRIASAIALLIAVFVAPNLTTLDQAFQFIQEFTGFVSPGILAIFMFGLFWKKATANSALWAAILTIPLSAGFKYLTPELPFIDRMGIIFILLSILVIVITLMEKKGFDSKAIMINKKLFETNPVFNVAAIGICGIIAVLYILFW
ncbi:MAG: sodium/sugar symporter [Bacteroidetes bacterium]|nr:sodium/sugar symporter [Bacteroidota bacterium]MBU2507589.1 sodium/sugar symporter [Bacteroidota bacterium]